MADFKVADFQEMVDYGDLDALKRPADRNDELIYEFENLDANALDQARDRMAIPPPPQGTDLLKGRSGPDPQRDPCQPPWHRCRPLGRLTVLIIWTQP